MYEIVTAGAQDKYLSFELSIIERALNYDEALTDEQVEITLRLMPDSLDSFSQVDNFMVSLIITGLVLISFVVVVYYLVLP